MMNTKLTKVAILGSGNIGSDILVKIKNSPFLQCSNFIGRRKNSPGIKFAKQLGVKTSVNGIQEIIDNPDSCAIVFDATSALDHALHKEILRKLNKIVVNLTPADSECYFIPAISDEMTYLHNDFSLITCGGQASVPIAWAISQIHPEVEYIEAVTNIASKSAGPATRINIDEYLETTENAIKKFTGCKCSKVILTLNPAIPCVNMQTTVMALIKNPKVDEIKKKVNIVADNVKKYVPGYNIVVEPVYENNRLITTVQVRGSGDYLPEYAGNLDIITCAAVKCAELIAGKL